MATINTDNIPDPQELLDRGFENFDNYRVENMKNLVAVKQVQTNQLDREHSRLLRKYGPEHPLTIQTRAKIELNQLQELEIEREIIRVETPAPIPDDKKWKVFGYVLSPDGKPICGINVFLFDENKRKIDSADSAETDEKGYFILKIEYVEKLPEKVFAGVSPREVSPQSLTPEAGQVEYVEIIFYRKQPPPPDSGNGETPSSGPAKGKEPGGKDPIAPPDKGSKGPDSPSGKKTARTGKGKVKKPVTDVTKPVVKTPRTKEEKPSGTEGAGTKDRG